MTFLGWGILACAVVAAAGAWPTLILGGRRAVIAMLVGCAASWLASAAGGWALLASERGRRGGGLEPPLVAMVVRLGVAVVLGVALALSGRVERTPLLLWIGISHLALLLADTRFAVAAVRRRVVSNGSLESGAR